MAPAGISKVASPVGAALQTLKTLCSARFARLPEVSAEWKSLLQSAFFTMLNYSKIGGSRLNFKFIENILL
jgi:hypothetical protein